MREFAIPAEEFWYYGDAWIRSVLEDVNDTGQPICSAPDGPSKRVYWAGDKTLAIVTFIPSVEAK